MTVSKSLKFPFRNFFASFYYQFSNAMFLFCAILGSLKYIEKGSRQQFICSFSTTWCTNRLWVSNDNELPSITCFPDGSAQFQSWGHMTELVSHHGVQVKRQEKTFEDKRTIQKTKPLTFHRSSLFVHRVLKLALKKKKDAVTSFHSEYWQPSTMCWRQRQRHRAVKPRPGSNAKQEETGTRDTQGKPLPACPYSPPSALSPPPPPPSPILSSAPPPPPSPDGKPPWPRPRSIAQFKGGWTV